MWYCTCCGIVINEKNPSPTNQTFQKQKNLLKNTDNSHESDFPISDHKTNIFNKGSQWKNFVTCYVSQRP